MTDIRIIKALAKGHQDYLNMKMREAFLAQGREVRDIPYDTLPPTNSIPGGPAQSFLDEIMEAAVKELEKAGFWIREDGINRSSEFKEHLKGISQ